MFPHDITIYRYRPELETYSEVYSTTYLNGVYIEKTLNGSVESNGETNNGEITVITSPENARRYELRRWRVQPGDFIVRGRGAPINGAADLDEYYKVTAVAENICGSDVDNVTIKAV